MRYSSAAFCEELSSVRERFDLNPNDLAIWLGRPRSTVYSWLYFGYSPPPGATLDELSRRLNLLRKSKAFPVPYTIGQRQRRGYILEAYECADNARISKAHSAGNGKKVRRRH